MKYILFLSLFLASCLLYAQESTDESPNKYRFTYKTTVFKGTKLQITNQLRAFKEHPNYQSIPEEIRDEINKLFLETKEQVFPRRYKKRAITFLETIDNYKLFIEFYNIRLYEVVRKLRRDINKIDFKLEREFTKAKVAYERIEKEGIADLEEIPRLQQEYSDSHTRLLCHRWMREKFEDYTTFQCVELPDDYMLEFKKKQARQMFTFFQEKNTDTVHHFLENEIIDFYYKKAVDDIDPDKLELQYINKI